LGKSKDGDYHQEMNSFVFFEWFENQLMPALKNPSLVVLDNASYHNVKTEDTVSPNCSQKKAVLQNYLTQHIPFSATDTTSFNRKVVLFLATKPLTCAHINSIGLSSVSNGGS
jgi:transposase